MKLIHLADLHIGKKLAGYSLLEDQAYIFDQIIEISKEFEPDAVLIAGDVYDRSVPGEDAVRLYESFITALSKIAPVYIISGNHDSGTRLGLFSAQLRDSNIHITGTFNGELEVQTLPLGKSEAKIYMLPYLSPPEARSILNRKDLTSYEECVEAILEPVELDDGKINILLTHQFYLNHRADYEEMPEGSERPIVGGLDDIHAKLLEDFDYAALGHIHGMRELGSGRMRYAGTPLKYSVNESDKYLNCIELDKDSINVQAVPLKPLRDVKSVRGTLSELTKKGICPDYVFVELTDSKPLPDVKARLLEVFPNLLGISFNYAGPENESQISDAKLLKMDPIDLLSEFFESKGQVLDEKEREIASRIFQDLESEETK